MGERVGLTSQQVEELVKEWGYNELPHVEISLWYVFFIQFTGLMPYVLEICCILALACQDWIDFAIIAAIVICNAYLGFMEELKAKASLDELTSKMEQKIAVLRDGKAEHLLTRLLVPGDVVLVLGGVQIPADVEWIEGDVLSVDTAALTGEPLPRKYPSEEYGNLILCGATIKAGEAYCVVRKTGMNTEAGSDQVAIMADKTKEKISVFEMRVLMSVKIIIAITIADVIIILLVQGLGRKQFNVNEISTLVLTCLSILIASIPVALPLVLQVTMALGAGKMATDFHSVVTSLPALQDISSMSVLCSDKTGTLTTARITIHAESVWYNGKFSKEDVALYAMLAANRDKKEDAIDRSVVNHFDKLFGPEGEKRCNEYKKIRSVGFNPIYKRVLYEFDHPKDGRLVIAKGLPAKVMNTRDGGEDDAADQWEVENFKEMHPEVSKADLDFSRAGYKTLGVSVKFGNGQWQFIGILPMLDPPRHDSGQTIRNLQHAGIRVKMITGDHLNIAKETARLIGMGTNISPGEATRVASEHRDQLIWDADGFAQVLPRDKREVVCVLRERYQLVVGMTGDGVNDAPALSAAQCGIAVDDATDAAKNAAAIILTSPGLSAIYSAVVESRRIFRKLKAYVTYRFAASMQIVVVLTLLIYISNCPIESLYIVLLALFNDLTMLPIAYDRQQASLTPEEPNVMKILALSGLLGILETCFSLLWAYASWQTKFFRSNFVIGANTGCSIQAQAGVWLQMAIATELLIFSARAPSYMWTSIPPSLELFTSVMIGCFIFSLLAGLAKFFGGLWIADIVIIWFYDIICLVIIDVVKVAYLKGINENTDVLADDAGAATGGIEHGEVKADVEHGHGAPSAASTRDESNTKSSGAVRRMESFVGDIAKDPTRRATMTEASINAVRSASQVGISTNRNVSASKINGVQRRTSDNQMVVASTVNTNLGSRSDLRGFSSTNLRPSTPAAAATARGSGTRGSATSRPRMI